ncbi:MAG: type II toxin-antitoxin system RelE/ParE family toxin [Pseudomonadota bacterium]
MAYQLIFSDTVQNLVRAASPDVRAAFKKKMEQLRTTPCIGKPLLRKLAGYYSVRTHKLRIIYKVISEKKLLEVHYVGPPRDLYQIIHQMRNGFLQ